MENLSLYAPTCKIPKGNRWILAQEYRGPYLVKVLSIRRTMSGMKSSFLIFWWLHFYSITIWYYFCWFYFDIRFSCLLNNFIEVVWISHFLWCFSFLFRIIQNIIFNCSQNLITVEWLKFKFIIIIIIIIIISYWIYSFSNTDIRLTGNVHRVCRREERFDPRHS